MAMMVDKWTDAEKARAKALWEEGQSASEIGRALYREFKTIRSRNAVISRSHRDQWPSHDKNPRYSRSDQVKKPPATRPPRPSRPTVRIAPAMLPSSEPVIASNPKSLIDLVDHECHWPLDNGLYCGAVCFGEYCETHARERRRNHVASPRHKPTRLSLTTGMSWR